MPLERRVPCWRIEALVHRPHRKRFAVAREPNRSGGRSRHALLCKPRDVGAAETYDATDGDALMRLYLVMVHPPHDRVVSRAPCGCRNLTDTAGERVSLPLVQLYCPRDPKNSTRYEWTLVALA